MVQIKGMKRQSLRVINDDPSHPLSGRNRALSMAQGSRLSAGSRLSFGSRHSVGGRITKPSKGTTPSKGMMTKAIKGITPSKGRQRSSGFGRSAFSNVKKDPRPTGDKKFKEKCIRELLEFLSEQGYPNQLTAKQLYGPSCKDFVKIFEFMCKILDPQYKCSPKPEEEIPRMMKEELMYPFPISKSSILSPGSPHTWPTLLAALTWLREHIMHALTTNVDTMLFPIEEDCDFDTIPEPKLVSEFVEQSYREFLAGSDTFEALEEQLAKKLRWSAGECQDDIDGELDRLRAQLETLQTGQEREQEKIRESKNMIASQEQDLTKLDSYCSQLDSCIFSSEQQMKTLQSENENLVEEVSALDADLAKKQAIYDSQELSQGDVEKMHQDHENLRRQTEATQNEMEETKRHIWKQEITMGKLSDTLDSKLAEGNKLLNLLGLIGETDLHLDAAMLADPTHFDIVFMPCATELLKEWKQKRLEREDECFQVKERLEQMTETSNSKEKDVRLLENDLKHIGTTIEDRKQQHNAQSEELEAELEKLREEMKELRLANNSSQEAMRQRLREEKHRFDTLEYERQKKIKKVNQFMFDLATMVLDHKAAISEDINRLAANIARICGKDPSQLAVKSETKK